MTILDMEKIDEIHKKTNYPDSISVRDGLFKVWNECEQKYRNHGNDTLIQNYYNMNTEQLDELIDVLISYRKKIDTNEVKTGEKKLI